MKDAAPTEEPGNEALRVSMRLPKRIIDDMDSVLAEGYYVDRSELIRDAVRRFLREEGL